MAGREDKGLTNSELDLCRTLAVIPTNPEYRSLNLAQALGIITYEVWQERTAGRVRRKPPAGRRDLRVELLEHLFADWEHALGAVDFFKTRQPELVLRSLREALFRATLDAREAALIRAMGIEVCQIPGATGHVRTVGPRRRKRPKKRTVIRGRRTTVLDSPHPPGLNAVNRSPTTTGDEFSRHSVCTGDVAARGAGTPSRRVPGPDGYLIIPACFTLPKIAWNRGQIGAKHCILAVQSVHGRGRRAGAERAVPGSSTSPGESFQIAS